MPKEQKSPKAIETITHAAATRKNIPTAEYQALLEQEALPHLTYPRRNRDLDPQLMWRGKDEQDWSDLVVPVPPLYIQEKIQPKILIDDLRRQSEAQAQGRAAQQLDMFADFNGLPSEAARTEFYQHEAHWSNRMILGDSLQVMASLAEREGLRGKVQCIYFDPPYGIKFNSNFQWSTTSRDVQDGKAEHITREPEQVKAFRDTWRDGIHSYLTYLRDRLTVARDLLAESGSIFVQISDENAHRLRTLLDEIFGDSNHIAQITLSKTSSATAEHLPTVNDFILWYAKRKESVKFRPLFVPKPNPLVDPKTKYDQLELEDFSRRALITAEKRGETALPKNSRIFRLSGIDSQTGTENTRFPISFEGQTFTPSGTRGWSSSEVGMQRIIKADRMVRSKTIINYIRYFNDHTYQSIHNVWMDIGGAVQSRSDPKIYVVQTGTAPIERCILMATDPGDLVLDPTCGSGTTAYVAEKWGRRWITVDTSRVALALARARIMGARYPYYLLKDSRAGQLKEAEISRSLPAAEPTYGNIRQGFVYERVPHITLKAIANNAEIDVIWDSYQQKLEPLREALNRVLSEQWSVSSEAKIPFKPLEEWEIPRERPQHWPQTTEHFLTEWWQQRLARQKEIDASIAAHAETEYLYDKPYEDSKIVRVAGPFTVESLSPHRVLGVDENEELIDRVAEGKAGYGQGQSFAHMILENLKMAGVQQAHKEDRIVFSSLTPWPGHYICAEGRYLPSPSGTTVGRAERGAGGEGENSPSPAGTTAGRAERGAGGEGEKRAGIFIGPEFGTVSRPDLVAAAREAGESGFDVLVACAFNYDARSTEFDRLGRVPILRARINADLHMAADLKNTGQGNLFVIFGEPDIDLLEAAGGQIQVRVNGVDVFHPSTGEVRSDGPEGIAIWFVDSDYNEESFFVRQAYFLGADDPYKSLKTTLKAEINPEAWASLRSNISRPFDKPLSGRIAVKVINHLGDEVMKVFKVR